MQCYFCYNQSRIVEFRHGLQNCLLLDKKSLIKSNFGFGLEVDHLCFLQLFLCIKPCLELALLITLLLSAMLMFLPWAALGSIRLDPPYLDFLLSNMSHHPVLHGQESEQNATLPSLHVSS